MKLSSLNRFKGKTVQVAFTDKDGEPMDIKGKLEEITPDFITIDFETGLENIPIRDIIRIEQRIV